MCWSTLISEQMFVLVWPSGSQKTVGNKQYKHFRIALTYNLVLHCGNTYAGKHTSWSQLI